jgi:RHS repeat-associated protein
LALTGIDSTQFVIDNNGNAQTMDAWDFENRLGSVTLPGSGGTVTFKYDPFGRRIYKSSSSATSIFAYDGDNLIEETNASGAVVARYTQNLNIDEPLAQLRSATTSYYQADGLGSITSLSNAAGALAQTYAFDSFGKLTASSGALTNPFQYASRELDTESSLYYMRARYFDPATGRFINEDFLRLPDGLSRYDYALNSPVNYVDPFGLCPWQVRQRPLKGGLGNAVKNLADPPPSHKYFYNPITGQSAGLGPAKNPRIYNPGKEVPGKWEPPEDPSKNPDDTLTGQVPDAICDCVDKKLRIPAFRRTTVPWASLIWGSRPAQIAGIGCWAF